MPASIAPEVVDAIAAGEDIDRGQAKRRALETWRLARAYLDDHAGVPPPPARRAHLRRTALARAWLREDFESTYDAGSVPADAVAQAENDPRIMHPRVHVVCQAIVTPPKGDGPGPPTAPDDARWRRTAEAIAARFAEHARTYLRQPGTEKNCDYVADLIAHEPQPAIDARWPVGMELRFESGVFEVCRDEQWDPGFVDALCPTDAPGIYGPFWTRYGAHVAVVIEVQDDDRPKTKTARDDKIRAALLDQWRASQYPTYIERLRARYDVRRVERKP